MTTPTVPRCAITDVADRAGVRSYTDFRRRLYNGDPGYSTTLEFAVENVLTGSTPFTRSCHVRPLLARSDGEVVAECILVHDPALPALQVAFFEALPDQHEAVEALLTEALAEAASRGLERIVVGLNAHLSIGVGILVDGFQRATFDSTWNKPGYESYFAGMERHGLTSYFGSVPVVVERMAPASRAPRPDADGRSLEVRPLDMRNWDRELETFRTLCDATLGTTPYYAPTRPGHFADLLGDLKPFLRPENLLFAMVDGREVGFCFWHPDYNEILPTGRRLGVPAIAWRFALRRRRIRTVVLNAIGVLPGYRAVATSALLSALAAEIDGSFDRYETSFVWDGNDASNGMGRYLGNQVLRRFAVWDQDLA